MADSAHRNDPPDSPSRADGRSAHATQLLISLGQGHDPAREELLRLVYDELRRLARGYLARERNSHTLQPTALVHEAYLRLIDQRQVDWRNRAQFVGVAAVMMRRILVNHAREHVARKRGGDAQRVTLSVVHEPGVPPDVDLLGLHDALGKLEAVDSRKSKIVELKFFGGMTTEEIGEVMQLSPATIKREWSFSKAWLYDAMGGAQG
jgi:RNA polymerase sigma factor (TIGR02999 family)